MRRESRLIIITNIFIVTFLGSWIICSEAVVDLLVSKVNETSQFICISNENKSIIWKKSSGELIYTLDQNNPRFENFILDDSTMPVFVLTLVKAQLTHSGEYQCELEETDTVIEHLTYIVVESDPAGGMNYNEINDTVNAWCSVKYAGKVKPSVTWKLMINNTISVLNTTSNSTIIFDTETPSSKMIISESSTPASIFNSTVRVLDLTSGSVMICIVEFRLESNATEYTFNWTSEAYLRRLSITTTDMEYSTSEYQASNTLQDKAGDAPLIDHSFTEKSKSSIAFAANDEKPTDLSGIVRNVGGSDTSSISGIVIGMIAALVVVVVVLIVVIIGMYAYFRSKTAASRRRRAESSYVMPLPADLPRSTSYEQIENIYNEPNAHRASIMSSHSYNYPEKCIPENAPPLPERDMASTGNHDTNWTSAEKLYNSEENLRTLKDPGVYLRMPDHSLLSKKSERSDEFGYTLVPGDHDTYRLSTSLGVNNESPYEKMNRDTGHEEDVETNFDNVSLVKNWPVTIGDLSRQATHGTRDGYETIANSQDSGYQKPLLVVPEKVKYAPLIKNDAHVVVEEMQGQDAGYQKPSFVLPDKVKYDPLIKRDPDVVADDIQDKSIIEAISTEKSDPTSFNVINNKQYLKLISD